MIDGVLTTCHKQYTWDRSISIFLFNRTTLQVFVTYLIGALYIHPLWFYKHQHDNRVRSKLFVECNNLQLRDTCGKRRNINLILDVTPYKEIKKKYIPWRNPIDRNKKNTCTPISSVLCMTNCNNPDNHFE